MDDIRTGVGDWIEEPEYKRPCPILVPLGFLQHVVGSNSAYTIATIVEVRGHKRRHSGKCLHSGQ